MSTVGSTASTDLRYSFAFCMGLSFNIISPRPKFRRFCSSARLCIMFLERSRFRICDVEWYLGAGADRGSIGGGQRALIACLGELRQHRDIIASKTQRVDRGVFLRKKLKKRIAKRSAIEITADVPQLRLLLQVREVKQPPLPRQVLPTKGS
eukprot:Hpha_TRINITY_DN16598_c1_g3::TRINITY_DN16598_c1_g3_i1::g.132900::m.132900